MQENADNTTTSSTTTTNVLRTFFQDHPSKLVPEEVPS